jgi:uncharacterized membrane protein
MEELVRVAKTLRTEHDFCGYIHLKTIPDASQELIDEAGRWLARGLPVLAFAEALFDKAPAAPDRTDAAAVLGRIAAGAALGAYVLRPSRILGAIVGGAAAAAATYVSFAVRSVATRRGRSPGMVAGLLEDGLVATAGSRLAHALP